MGATSLPRTDVLHTQAKQPCDVRVSLFTPNCCLPWDLLRTQGASSVALFTRLPSL